MTGPVVIVGAGQAGLQAAISLREGGYSDELTLIGDEPELPYQRPPLSKAYLLGKVPEDALYFRHQAVLADLRIRLLISERVIGIDRKHCTVHLASGDTVAYGHLILATGTRSRTLPVPIGDLESVVALRSLADAKQLRERLGNLKRAVVVGAGFIGLEFAAVAADRGISVHVIEAAPRAMARAVSPEMSEFFTTRHVERGVKFSFDTVVSRVEGVAGDVTVRLADGTTLPCDIVLSAVGAVPNDELAVSAGLPVANGIVVNEHLLTEDSAISAIGDCADHPNVHAGAMTRLESVQNAVDQGRVVAARLTGRSQRYEQVPWFWSDQGPYKLQIAGLTAGSDMRVCRGEGAQLAVFCFRQGTFVGLETVNRGSDHMFARKALSERRLPSITQAQDETFVWKSFLASAATPGRGEG